MIKTYGLGIYLCKGDNGLGIRHTKLRFYYLFLFKGFNDLHFLYLSLIFFDKTKNCLFDFHLFFRDLSKHFFLKLK